VHPFMKNVQRRLVELDQGNPWLSRQTGISDNTIRGWMNSDNPPKLDPAAKIAAALGTTIDALMSGQDSTPRLQIERDALRELVDILEPLQDSTLYEIKGSLRALGYVAPARPAALGQIQPQKGAAVG